MSDQLVNRKTRTGQEICHKKVREMMKFVEIFVFQNQARMKSEAFLSYQSVIKWQFKCSKMYSLTFKLFQNFMIFVILLVPMKILLAHARIQKFKKCHRKQRNSTKNGVYLNKFFPLARLSWRRARGQGCHVWWPFIKCVLMQYYY